MSSNHECGHMINNRHNLAPLWAASAIIFLQCSIVHAGLMPILDMPGGANFIMETTGGIDYFGITISNGGDINEDGLNDICVGAALADIGEESQGRVFIWFGGRKEGLSPDIKADLILNGSNDELAGGSVCIGPDINGDGVDDLVVSAPRGSMPGRQWAGRVYILFGRSNWPSEVLLAADADVIIYGAEEKEYAGGVVSIAHDMNGDGLGEVLIGAPATIDGKRDAGKGYIVYGRKNWPAEIDLATGADVTLLGSEEDGEACTAMSAGGDFDGDGLADLIIGAVNVGAFHNWRRGTACLLYGSSSLFGTIELGTGSDFMIGASTHASSVGESVSLADVNADGFSDLILGCAGGHSPDGELGEGTVHIVWGGERRTGKIDIDLESDVIINGPARDYAAGSSIDSKGDINGDGITDIVIGADTPGESYVVFGRRDWPRRIDLGVEADSTLYGEHGFSRFGRSVNCGGDVNGDGYADVLVGADLAGPGKAYLIYGSPPPMQLRVRTNPKRSDNERIFRGGNALTLDYSIRPSLGKPAFDNGHVLDVILCVQHEPGAPPPAGGGPIYLFRQNLRDILPLPPWNKTTPTFRNLTFPGSIDGSLNFSIPRAVSGTFSFLMMIYDRTTDEAPAGIVRSNRFTIEK